MTQWSPAFIVPAMTVVVAAIPVLTQVAPTPFSSLAIRSSRARTVGFPERE